VRAKSVEIGQRYWRLKPIQLVAIDVLDWLFPFVAVNVVWLLASLTIILLPPATASLFETAYNAHRGRAPEVRRFWAGIRRWFVKSWLWASGNLIVLALAYLLGANSGGHPIALAMAGVIPALLLIGQFYFWPYVMLQDRPSLRTALRNSVFSALGALPYLISYLALSLFILIPAIVTIAPFLLLAPILIAMLATYSLIGWLTHEGILHEDARDL
jgi:uncharacterized membrane protein YesL